MKMEQIELYLGVSNDKLEGSMSRGLYTRRPICRECQAFCQYIPFRSV